MKLSILNGTKMVAEVGTEQVDSNTEPGWSVGR